MAIANSSALLSTYIGIDNNGVEYYSADGKIYKNMTAIATLSTYTTGDIVGVAWNSVTGDVWFSKNGTFTGNPAAGTGAQANLTGTIYPAATIDASGSVQTIQAVNTYSIPSGFKLWD